MNSGRRVCSRGLARRRKVGGRIPTSFEPEKGREQQFILLDIIYLKIGGGIEDLDTVAVGTVEHLTCGIAET